MQHVGRHPGLEKQLHRAMRDQWCLLRGFREHRIARCKSGRDLARKYG